VRLILLLIIFSASTESLAQTIDSVLSAFKLNLKEQKSIHQETLKEFEQLHSSLLANCENRFKFYKAYSNFQYNHERDDLVLILQKDSIHN